MKKNIKMKTLLIPLTYFLITIACGNPQKGTTGSTPPSENPTPKNNLPACLNEQLTKIQSHQYENPPVQIDEYEFQGKRVFLFTADCCDQYNILFDENCHGFCAPSGGITGKGDGKCASFNKEAKFVRNIYKK